MKTFKRIFLISLFCISLILFPLISQAVNIEDVPNPRAEYGGWVTDMADILSADTESQLNTIIGKLEAENGAEIAVVTVPDTEPYNSPKDFTTRLFNHWGIGKAEEDNGILFMISEGDRRVEIETGYGMEAILPDAKVGNILDTHILPHFKNNDFDAGTLAGTKALINVVSPPENTNQSSLPTPDPKAITKPNLDAGEWVSDEANLFSPEVEQKLNRTITKVYEQGEVKVIVATVSDSILSQIQNQSYKVRENFQNQLLTNWELSLGSDTQVLLFLLSPQRPSLVITSDGLEDRVKLLDEGAFQMKREVEEHLKTVLDNERQQGSLAQGVISSIREMVRILNTTERLNSWTPWISAGVIVLGVASYLRARQLAKPDSITFALLPHHRTLACQTLPDRIKFKVTLLLWLSFFLILLSILSIILWWFAGISDPDAIMAGAGLSVMILAFVVKLPQQFIPFYIFGSLGILFAVGSTILALSPYSLQLPSVTLILGISATISLLSSFNYHPLFNSFKSNHSQGGSSSGSTSYGSYGSYGGSGGSSSGGSSGGGSSGGSFGGGDSGGGGAGGSF